MVAHKTNEAINIHSNVQEMVSNGKKFTYKRMKGRCKTQKKSSRRWNGKGKKTHTSASTPKPKAKWKMAK